MDNGRYILPGALTCNACYQITVTKSGYSDERTYSNAEVANPSKPHLTILQGQLTEVSFAIDELSTLNIATNSDRESGFTPLSSLTFQMRGSKTIGTDTNGLPVYKFDQALTTNASGTLTMDNLEWDNYQIFMQPNDPWDISGTNPLLPLLIDPNTTTDFTFALDTHTANSLLTTFVDPSGVQIASVSATLSDGGSYSETILSGESINPDFGQAFFGNLSEQNYNLIATISGYLDLNVSIPVSERAQEKIILTPN
jgi:hypothetical protein